MKIYLITYEDKDFNSFHYFAFEPNAKEAVRKFADSEGDDSDLFELAISNLTDINDVVQMYNHFAYYNRIDGIYEVSKTVWEADI